MLHVLSECFSLYQRAKRFHSQVLQKGGSRPERVHWLYWMLSFSVNNNNRTKKSKNETGYKQTRLGWHSDSSSEGKETATGYPRTLLHTKTALYHRSDTPLVTKVSPSSSTTLSGGEPFPLLTSHRPAVKCIRREVNLHTPLRHMKTTDAVFAAINGKEADPMKCSQERRNTH